MRVSSFIDKLCDKYPDLQVVRKNVFVKENREFQELLADYYNVPEDKRSIIPSIFLGKAFIGEDQIKHHLGEQVRKISLFERNVPGEPLEVSGKNPATSFLERFQSFGVPVIAFAGNFLSYSI